MDVYNIIKQLTDQEDVNSGQMKRECFNKLLPIKDYYLFCESVLLGFQSCFFLATKSQESFHPGKIFVAKR